MVNDHSIICPRHAACAKLQAKLKVPGRWTMTAASHIKPVRAWQRMLSGRRLDLLAAVAR